MKINIHNTLKDLNFNGENVLLKSKSSFFIDLFFFVLVKNIFYYLQCSF